VRKPFYPGLVVAPQVPMLVFKEGDAPLIRINGLSLHLHDLVFHEKKDDHSRYFIGAISTREPHEDPSWLIFFHPMGRNEEVDHGED